MLSTLPNRVFVPSHVLFQIMDNKLVVLNTQTELYFALDEAGARIWELLSDGVSSVSALETIVTEYDIDTLTVEKDMLNLLSQLEEKKLIHFGN